MSRDDPTNWLAVPLWLAQRRDLPATAKLVWALVAYRQGAEGEAAWPGVESMAADLGIGKQAARQAIDRLVGLGLLVVEWSRGGRKRTHHYWVAYPPEITAGPAGGNGVENGPFNHPKRYENQGSKGMKTTPPNGVGITPESEHGTTTGKSAPAPPATPTMRRWQSLALAFHERQRPRQGRENVVARIIGDLSRGTYSERVLADYINAKPLHDVGHQNLTADVQRFADAWHRHQQAALCHRLPDLKARGFVSARRKADGLTGSMVYEKDRLVINLGDRGFLELREAYQLDAWSFTKGGA